MFWILLIDELLGKFGLIGIFKVILFVNLISRFVFGFIVLMLLIIIENNIGLRMVFCGIFLLILVNFVVILLIIIFCLWLVKKLII